MTLKYECVLHNKAVGTAYTKTGKRLGEPLGKAFAT